MIQEFNYLKVQFLPFFREYSVGMVEPAFARRDSVVSKAKLRLRSWLSVLIVHTVITGHEIWTSHLISKDQFPSNNSASLPCFVMRISFIYVKHL